jgi:hypothetical protein
MCLHMCVCAVALAHHRMLDAQNRLGKNLL